MNLQTPNSKAPEAASQVSSWWRGAAIYQIYPRSFLDSNADGIGDLSGITRGLDYIASLGVNGIWISPFFTSPMRDFGYDVSNYCDVDPIFGTLADFDALVSKSHSLGLKVIIDLVLAHTSDQHPWFDASRKSRDNSHSDWYVWADPRPDGTPPSNWQSVFGGPAWTWDARRRQYYMHQFLKEQPQLNVHNPDVQEALFDVVRFWLNRGVDGFRLDALNHTMFDPNLRDNPPSKDNLNERSRPFDFQERRFSQDHPGVITFIERLRQVCLDHESKASPAPVGDTDIFTVAEIGGAKPIPLMKAYTAGTARLSSAYSFAFLYCSELTPRYVKATLADWNELPNRGDLLEGWPSWAFDNHDAPRSVSRWCKDGTAEDKKRFASMEIALLAALRGNIFLYQGQELGLEQDEIPFEELKDPEAIANWPLTLGRDGVRTPFPWRDENLGGFTTGKPWLGLSRANTARAVEVQETGNQSLLKWTRHVLALRKKFDALRLGSLEQCYADDFRLSFDRVLGDEKIHCIFNFGPQEIVLSNLPAGEVILNVNDATDKSLPQWGALFIKAKQLQE